MAGWLAGWAFFSHFFLWHSTPSKSWLCLSSLLFFHCSLFFFLLLSLNIYCIHSKYTSIPACLSFDYLLTKGRLGYPCHKVFLAGISSVPASLIERNTLFDCVEYIMSISCWESERVRESAREPQNHEGFCIKSLGSSFSLLSTFIRLLLISHLLFSFCCFVFFYCPFLYWLGRIIGAYNWSSFVAAVHPISDKITHKASTTPTV